MKKKETASAYKKRLARVRAYTKDRREWQKLVKMGDTTYPTLQEFRDSKYGKFSARQTEKEVQGVQVPDPADVEGKLERLLSAFREIKSLSHDETLKRLFG